MKFVLVTGCPRSGTTATAEWLLASRKAQGDMETRRTIVGHAMTRAAERFWCFRPDGAGFQHGTRATSTVTLSGAIRDAVLSMYGRLDNSRVLVDKEPLEPVALPAQDYIEYLRTVRDALDARLVAMVRDPADVIASMLQRKWGYSVVGDPVSLPVERCTEIWRRANRACLRLSVTDPGSVRLQPYETLCAEPTEQSMSLRGFTGLVDLPDFRPARRVRQRDTAQDRSVYDATTWERRLLGYDERLPGAPGIVLVTGEPGAGKTTLARAVEAAGAAAGRRVTVLDGDELRANLWPDLGYSDSDREASVSRTYRLAVRVAAAGSLVVIAMVAPAEAVRAAGVVSARVAGIPHVTVRVSAPAAARAARRPPRAGFVDVVYEEPPAPDLIIDGTAPVEAGADAVLTRSATP